MENILSRGIYAFALAFSLKPVARARKLRRFVRLTVVVGKMIKYRLKSSMSTQCFVLAIRRRGWDKTAPVLSA